MVFKEWPFDCADHSGTMPVVPDNLLPLMNLERTFHTLRLFANSDGMGHPEPAMERWARKRISI